MIGLASQAEAQGQNLFPSQVGIGAAPNEDYIDLYYRLGQQITPIVFPEATGGSGTLRYSLDGGFASLGFAFDPATRTLSGTPTLAGFGSDGSGSGFELTYAVDINGGGFDTITVYVTVCEGAGGPSGTQACTAPSFSSLGFSTALADQVYEAGKEITSLTLPEATGGTGSSPRLLYALPSLPAGLSFDPATRTLSGTPTTTGLPAMSLTYTATGVDGTALFSGEFTVTIFMLFLSEVDDPQSYTVSGAITPLILPEATGGDASVTYTLAGPSGGSLPVGLVFDETTRVLSGTPTRTGTITLTYTATEFGSDAATTSREFAVTVVVDGLALNTVPEQNYSLDVAIINLVLPEATAAGLLTYTLTGVIPAGLSFNEAARALSGTPTMAGTTILTYTVTESESGATTRRMFTVTVVDGLALNTVPDQSYHVGIAITPLRLPAATTIDTDTTTLYGLVGSSGGGSLPVGLVFDETTRVLSGTRTIGRGRPR